MRRKKIAFKAFKTPFFLSRCFTHRSRNFLRRFYTWIFSSFLGTCFDLIECEIEKNIWRKKIEFLLSRLNLNAGKMGKKKAKYLRHAFDFSACLIERKIFLGWHYSSYLLQYFLSFLVNVADIFIQLICWNCVGINLILNRHLKSV